MPGTDLSPPAAAPDGEVRLARDDLARLLAEVEVRVTIQPLSGTNVATDYWMAVFEELWIENHDLGIDAAVIGLAAAVRERVGSILARDESEQRDRQRVVSPALAAKQSRAQAVEGEARRDHIDNRLHDPRELLSREVSPSPQPQSERGQHRRWHLPAS